MKIYLVRHGQTDWNKELIIQGRINNPLNEVGRNQAKEISNFFKNIIPNAVYSTSLSRAQDTANIVFNNSYELIINDNFIEREFGELEGKLTKAFYEIEDYNKINGYEDDKTVINRVENGFFELVKENENDSTVAIFAHAHILKAALILLDDEKYSFETKISNCGILEIDIDSNATISNIIIHDHLYC